MNKMELAFWLDKDEFESRSKQVLEISKKELELKGYYFPEISGELTEFAIENGKITLELSMGELGWFSTEIPIDEGITVEIIKETIKRLNKFRAAIEALS